MAADHCETETEDPSSLTGLHLSISDYPLRDSLLNTPISKGCYRLFKWAMHAGFFVSTWGGGGESLVSHLTTQVSPKYIHQGKSTHGRIKVTIITRYNIIDLLTIAYSYDLCWSLHMQVHTSHEL